MRPVFKITYASLFLLLSLTLTSCRGKVSGYDAQEEDASLKEQFAAPPTEARARTWWHWLNGNISRAGITSDLEAMKRVGIQEAQIFNVDLGLPFGGIEYLSEEWLAMFQFAASEADRLELELSFHNSAGWSSSGGPWIDAEHAMQTLVHSEITVQGNQRFQAQLPQPETKLGFYRDVAVLAFPKPTVELKIKNLDYKTLSERIRNHVLPDTTTTPPAATIDKNKIIDLQTYFSADGNLTWDVPEGEWVILRLGHTPTGVTNRPAMAGGRGLECDKMSKKAVELHWANGVQPIVDALGEYVGPTVKSCLIDSYEVGATNWTSGFEAEFQRLREYDLMAYLPTLAGYFVESGEVSERFLWDFRRTIGDLIAENYYARFGELCHQADLSFSVEPYWGPFDNMQIGATGDIVMCEFWTGGYPFFDSPKFVSSIAHLNGSSIVGAESFTGIGGWDEHPAVLKTIGDRAWAQGINRFIFHSYVHQPWSVAPGLELSYHGTDFNRLNTWWEQGRAYMDYIGRSQFLLQHGKSVADVLVFTGESSPNDALLMPEVKQMGYDYDLIGVHKLYDLRVEDGDIVTPAGGRYHILVLPEQQWMRPKTVQKLAEIANAGGKIIGPSPRKSPSLTGYPECDDRVQSTAAALWGNKIVKDIPILDYLKTNGLPPDFKVEGQDATDLSFIHRSTGQHDVYFVASARKESRSLNCQFRVKGKKPEIWNAETGEIIQAAVWNENPDGTTTVPLFLEAEQAVFVVFKPTADNDQITKLSVSAEPPAAAPLPGLEIISAEYGTFLQEGLVDITDRVASAVANNKLSIRATRHFCDCDPAMGYTKEFRLEYTIGDRRYQLSEMERDSVIIDPKGKGKLVVLKAVFGKFLPETTGVPARYPIQDVTSIVKKQVASGKYDMVVDDQLFLGGKEAEGNQPELRVTYLTDGETNTATVSRGKRLKLSKDMPVPKVLRSGNDDVLLTPYPVQVLFNRGTSAPETRTVGSVPEPLPLNGPWVLSYPKTPQDTQHVSLQQLTSWSTAADTSLRYFSGTAKYSTTLDIPDSLIGPGHSLELDLGSVHVIAEVSINGKDVGVLWKAPFSINLDGYAVAGENLVDIEITNLWPNRLIGDERLPVDYTIKKNKVNKWPNWLATPAARTSGRTTFPSFHHWNKDDKLRTSGLLGPVRLNVYRRLVLD